MALIAPSSFPPEGIFTIYSKVSGGKVYYIANIQRGKAYYVYYIVNIPGEGLLCGMFTIRHRNTQPLLIVPIGSSIQDGK